MYKLSKLAAEDFAAIYEYTLLNFGVRQHPDPCLTGSAPATK
ncbi:hypothetical protein [Arsukibacterium ikkense]|nr:hypothetical protein [Arsukibacterium ikkense]